ncbi:MAG: HAD family hydrolase, partial [Butyricicoccaceae bacterium]
DTLVQWVQTSPELSEEALKREIEQNDSPCLRKTLSWITLVRAAITLLPEEEQRPFEGARRALAQAHRYADIAVLSGDNLGAVLDEWDLYGLLEYTDIVLAREFGSKTCCIRELLRQGYEANRVVLCGDAPDDLEAARANGVLYYPILVKHENESWAEFAAEGLTQLLDGSFSGAYQQRKIDEFFKHLGGSS